MDAAVGRAGAAGDHRPGSWRQPVEPLVKRDRLAGLLVVTDRGPVTFGLYFLVGNGAFDDQDEGIEPALPGVIEILHQLVAVLVGQYSIVQVDLGQSGNGPEDYIFDTGQGGIGDGDAVAVTAHAVGSPKDINFLDARGLTLR